MTHHSHDAQTASATLARIDSSNLDGNITTQDCVDLLMRLIEESGLRPGDRLPPERDLAEQLSVTRGRLRQALAQLVQRRVVWRHVGKGTFLNAPTIYRPEVETLVPPPFARTDPLQLLDARLVVEPKLAAMAAIRGTGKQFETIREWVDRGKASSSYTGSQEAGDGWHLSVAESARNELLLWVFNQLFYVRDHISWGRLSADLHPTNNARVWQEHEAITDAICTRYAVEAERLMRVHLESLRTRITDMI